MVRTKRVVKKVRGQAASTSGRHRKAEQSLEESGESTDTKQRRINLGHHIMRQMVYYKGRSTLALVYGTLITLLMENAGVDLRGIESRDLHSQELLNESSLNKMGYVFSARTNSWEMNQKRRRRGQDDEGMQLILKRLARIELKLDDHICNCQMATPIGPRGTRGDPSTAGTSSGQQPTDPFSHPKA
ncbi:hypothetical protein SLEP1_g25230 [Rubroshorea leprosula]|uniref:Uncharacterized protein n=1 Tax=Rubroshorea leprosula TaxID=152421 RepID=A0AAV5JI21_9ROSI|nr:hypothetical protein SLEP1_g25230 [Rubroshorea leprosula]